MLQYFTFKQSDFKKLFTDPQDCSIFTAMKRAGIPVDRVSVTYAVFKVNNSNLFVPFNRELQEASNLLLRTCHVGQHLRRALLGTVFTIDVPEALTKKEKPMTVQQTFSNSETIGVHARTLGLVQEFGYRTSAELAAKINPAILTGEQIHKALSKLFAQGKVAKHDVRPCTITGRTAVTWVAA